METFDRCPSCMKQALGHHCASKKCGWRKCLLKAGGCEAVIDLKRRRGVRYDRRSKQFVAINLSGL